MLKLAFRMKDCGRNAYHHIKCCLLAIIEFWFFLFVCGTFDSVLSFLANIGFIMIFFLFRRGEVGCGDRYG
ncbi:hypothetical protein HD806DRAFT_483551 [Xylariaceae sp. AK1471]|nr:hypothetical protein HD806DRAFT_483551 [Xylariaceae sp. AK1471]